MLSWTHILVVAGVTLLLFGRGRISDLMGDVAKGIKSFKKGLADEPAEAAPTPTPEASHAPQASHASQAPRAVAHQPAGTGEGVRAEERAQVR